MTWGEGGSGGNPGIARDGWLHASGEHTQGGGYVRLCDGGPPHRHQIEGSRLHRRREHACAQSSHDGALARGMGQEGGASGSPIRAGSSRERLLSLFGSPGSSREARSDSRGEPNTCRNGASLYHYRNPCKVSRTTTLQLVSDYYVHLATSATTSSYYYVHLISDQRSPNCSFCSASALADRLHLPPLPVLNLSYLPTLQSTPCCWLVSSPTHCSPRPVDRPICR